MLYVVSSQAYIFTNANRTLHKLIGGFNHKVVTLVANKYKVVHCWFSSVVSPIPAAAESYYNYISKVSSGGKYNGFFIPLMATGDSLNDFL